MIGGAGHPGQHRSSVRAAHPGPPSHQRVSNRALSAFLDACALAFGKACHTLGALFIRLLSTFMIIFGVVATVVLQTIAFYYLGVLNPHPLIATILYVPTLVGLAVLRGEMRKLGTSTSSGIGPPRESHPTTIAYLLMTVAAFLSISHPVLMRMFNYVSLQSMWLALLGTALFYYSILISEVLFATSINLYNARRMEKRGGLYAPLGFPNPTVTTRVHSDASMPLAETVRVPVAEAPSTNTPSEVPGPDPFERNPSSVEGHLPQQQEIQPIQSYY